MIKGSIEKEDITIANIYVPNIGAPKYTEQIVRKLKEETNAVRYSWRLYYSTLSNG